MPSTEQRSLLQLDTSLAITIPKVWATFWQLRKGEKVQILYDTVLVVIPQDHPNSKKVENKVKRILAETREPLQVEEGYLG